MTLPEINKLYSTDDKCRELLERLRWPEGVTCPRCKDRRVSRMKDYARFECVGCEYQFTVTSGTIFHDSHLPLPTWFLAVLLLCEAKKGMSAMQIKRTLGVAYKTAWYLCHRIRAAMASTEKMTFRFNRRNRSDLFLDTLRHMVTADPLTFDELTS